MLANKSGNKNNLTSDTSSLNFIKLFIGLLMRPSKSVFVLELDVMKFFAVLYSIYKTRILLRGLLM